jgi:SAM-dependent methyltransferase
MNYHGRYIDKLKTFTEIKGRDIAVFGCSFGKECELFINEGANSVVGFDLDNKVGSSFSNKSVQYFQRSVTETGMPSNTFDIVYSVAVFEHVQNIIGGYEEAIRVCRPGGVIMILSSPIWHAPYGSHMISVLERMPWCHLLFNPSNLICEIERIYPDIIENHEQIERIVGTIYDPIYFNRYPPEYYVNSVNSLKGVEIMANTIWKAAVKDEYKQPYLELCLNSGLRQSDLLSGAHYFQGRK